MTKTIQLAEIINELVEEKIDQKMTELEKRLFAQSKQTRFTRKQLANRWHCSVAQVIKILKDGHVLPVEWQGQTAVYDLADTEEAKDKFDSKKTEKYQERELLKLVN